MAKSKPRISEYCGLTVRSCTAVKDDTIYCKYMNIAMSEQMWADLRLHALSAGCSASELCRALISKFLEEHPAR